MNIDMQSIMSKVRNDIYSEKGKARSKRYIRQCVDDGTSRTHGGSEILTKEKMESLADSMIEILQTLAASYNLPRSVFDNIMSLRSGRISADYSGPKEDQYSVNLFFEDDLSRPSLRIVSGGRAGGRTGGGITNIISLFDTGANINTSREISGLWEGHEELGEVSATLYRPKLHFMMDAVNMFNNTYAERYNAYAYIPEGDFYAK